MNITVNLSEVFSQIFAQMQEIMHIFRLLRLFISLNTVLINYRWNVFDIV